MLGSVHNSPIRRRCNNQKMRNSLFIICLKDSGSRSEFIFVAGLLLSMTFAFSALSDDSRAGSAKFLIKFPESCFANWLDSRDDTRTYLDQWTVVNFPINGIRKSKANLSGTITLFFALQFQRQGISFLPTENCILSIVTKYSDGRFSQWTKGWTAIQWCGAWDLAGCFSQLS